MKNLILIIIIICTQLINIIAQPIADFSSDITEGCSSIVVHFTNNSSPQTGLLYNWDFGNGTSSTVENPTVAYTQPGVYTVTLAVSDGVNNDIHIKEDYIIVFSSPQANINIEGDISGCAPHTVLFLDNSTPGDGIITVRYWDFGDGTISANQNQEHVFTYQSNFSVSLIVTDNNNCSDINTYNQLISVFKPTSFFLADPLSSCNPNQQVNFYNNSEGIGDLNYFWDFGDGSTSDDIHPTHTYVSNDNYDVELIVYDEQSCSDTLIREDYIELVSVHSDFEISSTTICPNEEVTITNLSDGAGSYYWDFGDGTFSENENVTHSYSEPGTYQISLTASHIFGCTDTKTKTIIVENVIADFHLADNFSCELPVTVQYINDSQNAVSYEWHLGNGEILFEENPYVEYLKKGIYKDTLIAISSFGCRSEKVIDSSMTIVIPRAYFTPNMWVDKWDIKGCAPHTVDFLNKSNYNTEHDEITNYYWDFGDGDISNEENPSHTFYDIGKYTVNFYYTTSEGCTSAPYFAEAAVGSEQTADFYKILPDTICASQEIQFFDNSSDSSLINEWYWQFGDSGYSLKENPIYTYTDTGYMDVKLQAYYNGCGVAKEIENFVYIKGPIVDINYNIECNKPYEAHLNSNAIDADKVYWNFGDGSPVDSISTNPIHIYPDNENYNVTLQAYNNTSKCNYSSNYNIIIKDVKANFEISDSIGCENLYIEINSEKSNDEFFFFNSGQYGKYLWDFGDGNKILITKPAFKHIYEDKGKYQLKLTVQDIRGCKDSLIKEISIFKPEPEFTTDNLVGCMPMDVTFNNQSDTDTTILSWEWNFGDNSTSNIENPSHKYTEFGIYDVSLTAIDTLGCKGTIYKNNYIEALKPIPDFLVNDNTICLGDTISLSPLDTSGITSYLWNFGDGFSSTDIFPNHKYTQSGYFPVSLTLTDYHGCDSTQIINDLIYIQDIPEPFFKSSDVTADCYPLQVNFIDTTNNLDVIDWFWRFGDGETSSHLKKPIHIYTAPGNYDVSLNVTTGNGCKQEIKKPKYIDIKGPYAEMNVVDTVCRNEEGFFMAEKKIDVYELQWIFGDGNTSSSDTAYHSYNNIGYMYPVLLLKSDELGTCDIYLSDSIFIPQLIPEINATDDVFNDCVPFEFNPYNNSSDVSTWLWDFGDGTIAGTSNPQHTFYTPGTYNVKLTIYNDFGCADSSEVSVEVHSLPSVTTMNDTIICRGDNIQLNAFGAENYEWYPKIYLDNENSNQPTSEPDSTIIYYVTGTDLNGCINYSNVKIDVQQIPVVNLNDTAVIIGEDVLLNAYSNQILTYNWFPDYEINCNNCSEIIVTPQEPTNYELTVTDINGCFERTYNVFVDILKKYSIDVPSAFTPNGDGINDIVYVRGWGVEDLLLFRIYNRYGEIIFESTDKNIGWDGTYKGKIQGVETYTYEVNVRTYEDEILTKTGTIKILK